MERWEPLWVIVTYTKYISYQDQVKGISYSFEQVSGVVCAESAFATIQFKFLSWTTTKRHKTRQRAVSFFTALHASQRNQEQGWFWWGCEHTVSTEIKCDNLSPLPPAGHECRQSLLRQWVRPSWRVHVPVTGAQKKRHRKGEDPAGDMNHCWLDEGAVRLLNRRHAALLPQSLQKFVRNLSPTAQHFSSVIALTFSSIILLLLFNQWGLDKATS